MTSDWQPIYGSMAERERHYERQTKRVTAFNAELDRKMAQKRPSLKRSEDAPGLWKKAK